MPRSVNRIFLMGNVGREPDVQETRSGTAVAHISLATDRRLPHARSEEGEERTDWHRLTCWGRLAQFVADHVSTGDRIYVEGTIEYNPRERPCDCGRCSYTLLDADITVKELVLLTPRAGVQSPAGEG